ncbi:MAG: 30S ribosomal protein S6 [Phycisphaerales bacterium]|nr:30S ribosomal protein S6 [Phycisphaerales bacterium]
MSDTTKRIYEGMFLFPQSAIADMQAAHDHVHALLQRVDADIVSFRKWDERRLAYEIKGNKRGLYFLAYFNCDPTKIASLENDCNLSESLLRFLVTKADHINPEEIEAADGRTELADEIKLRAAQAAEQTETNTTSSVSVGSKEEEAPAEEAAPADAAADTPEKEESEPTPSESTETPAEA